MESKPITSSLGDWDDTDLIRAAEAVKPLLEHPGWQAILEGVRSRERALNKAHLSTVTDSAAKYADQVGHMKGLRELEGIAKGIVQRGAEAEQARRESERAA